MEGFEARIANNEEQIRGINSELREMKRDMSRQDERIENKIDEKFKEMKIDFEKNNDAHNIKTERIFQSLDAIKDFQHQQSLANLQINKSLEDLNKEREEDKEDKKKMKWGIYGIIFTLISTFIGTWIKMQMGA